MRPIHRTAIAATILDLASDFGRKPIEPAGDDELKQLLKLFRGLSEARQRDCVSYARRLADESQSAATGAAFKTQRQYNRLHVAS